MNCNESYQRGHQREGRDVPTLSQATLLSCVTRLSLHLLALLLRPMPVVPHDVGQQRLAAGEDTAEGLIHRNHCRRGGRGVFMQGGQTRPPALILNTITTWPQHHRSPAFSVHLHLTDNVKEADLALGDAPLVAVKQGRDGQAEELLPVPLPEKLHTAKRMKGI